MSAERDLLNKALSVLLELKDCSDSWCKYYVPIGIHYRIDEAIQELLAQPEQTEQEPVAWMVETHFNNEPIKEIHTVKPMERVYKYCKVTELYTSPKREPLSEDAIWDNLPENPMGCAAFIRGVIFAEKAHGIGGGE